MNPCKLAAISNNPVIEDYKLGEPRYEFSVDISSATCPDAQDTSVYEYDTALDYGTPSSITDFMTKIDSNLW